MHLFLTPKRVFLSLMSLLVILVLGSELVGSLQESQIQDRLELYQTQLVLQASAWRDPDHGEIPNLEGLKANLWGEDPLKDALEQYRQVDQQLQTRNDRPTASGDPLAWSTQEYDRLILDLGLLTLLQAPQDTTAQTQALETWSRVQDPQLQATAQVLANLWDDPPRLLPNGELLLNDHLQGWFRYRSLERLYDIQQRLDALSTLQSQEQAQVDQILIKLLVLTGLPLIGMVLGIALIVGLSLRTWWRGRTTNLATNLATNLPTTPQDTNPSGTWVVPWDGDLIWQGIVIGFFLVGQILLVRFLIPLGILGLRSLLGPSLLASMKFQAIFLVVVYILMALGVLGVLYWLLRPYFPLPNAWFKIRPNPSGTVWGITGYLMALPLVTLISLLNQQLWHGQGGSNPLLFLALQNHDRFALVCFFITAALAAPLFEEFIFRGFLLASLTRYLPVWGAIALSGLIFALAHLSLSELLPLWILGMVLGYTYTRTQNLWSPMVLHSLWNTGTLVGLTILGNGLNSP